ncbi:MAG TPA: hypothetical protein VN851_19145, partial [Thermoanaerobaculia bacterium]|nr:hypothetical protein [Thermoanaerobaculia bacterium]
EANMRAMVGYPRRTYDGRIVYVRAETRRPGEPANPELPWLGAAADGVEFHLVPGDHLSMHRPPHVARLAAILERHLGGGRR